MSDAKKEMEGPAWIEGIDTRLEVMSAVPLVLSTPVSLLAEHRITDKKYLFVRNIQDLAEGMTMDPVPLEGWEIELVGLIRPFRVVIRAEDLLAMEQVEYEMILQCSGNGRNQYPGSAMQVMLCPECTAKNRDYSISYRLAFIRQHYLDTTTCAIANGGLSGMATVVNASSVGRMGDARRALRRPEEKKL